MSAIDFHDGADRPRGVGARRAEALAGTTRREALAAQRRTRIVR